MYRHGRVVKAYPFVARYKAVDHEESAPLRLAISVPKRKVKLAVDRNRIKRRVREAYRTQKNELCDLLRSSNQHWHVLLIFVGSPDVSQKIVNEKISSILARFCEEVVNKHETDEDTK